VTNTGPVISPGDVQRLFQPFQRLDPRRTHRTGHGLGLSIVRAIASAHGASINAQARTDGGLKIQVVFQPWTGTPLVPGEQPASEDNAIDGCVNFQPER